MPAHTTADDAKALAPRRAGRPTKYSPAVAAKIEAALRVGLSYRLACDYAGIDLSTFDNWRVRYSEFSEMVNRVRAEAAVGWMAVIDKAAVDDWRAAAWKLERRFPDQFGPKSG